MKGKTTFTTTEANEIRTILVELRKVGREAQKEIRNDLRQRIGFYISDFSFSKTGFTIEDFDSLIKDNIVKIK